MWSVTFVLTRSGRATTMPSDQHIKHSPLARKRSSDKTANAFVMKRIR